MRTFVLVIATACANAGLPHHGSDAPVRSDAPEHNDAMADASIPVPRNGLVAEWLFNKDASDTSGNSHVATVHGATLVDDRFGQPMSAYQFNGTNASIEIADAPDLALTGDLTISAWIKPDSITKLAGIVSKYQVNQDSSYTLRLGFTAPYSYYDFDNALLGAGAQPAMVVAGQWQHVAVVLKAGAATIYANGAAGTAKAPMFTIMTNVHSLWIGVDYSTRFFAGAIDDIRLYSRALEDFEIGALFSEHP
jgi:hypothetical protein